jgi:hypothetical protein
MLFLRKALIAFPFLLGSLVFMPQVALSAAIGTARYTIDPFPLQPTESTQLFLDIIEIGGICDLIRVVLRKSKIDKVNKRIDIALGFESFGGTCPSPDNFRVKIIDNLPDSGEYQVIVYDEPLNASSFFNDQNKVGSFNLSINKTSNIPTLSEWMLILMALLLLFFATRKMQMNSVPVKNK